MHTALASVGASAILAFSPIAYDLLKLVGGAYLIFIGVMMMRKRAPESAAAVVGASGVRAAFQQGMLTNLLNPKVALFFLASIPQFVDAGAADARWGIVVLSLTFVATGAAWCVFLAVGASAPGDVIKNSAVGTWLPRVCGAFNFADGVGLARNGQRALIGAAICQGRNHAL